MSAIPPQQPTTPTPAAPMSAQQPVAKQPTPQPQPNAQAGLQTPEPNHWLNFLRGVGNFFHYVPIMNMIADPMMGSAVRNAAKGYADYRGKYGQAADAALKANPNAKLPTPVSFADYLKQRNLYDEAMSNQQNRRIVWLDQAHHYHDQGNAAAAKVALEYAGDNENQINEKMTAWDTHKFMRTNSQQLNHALMTKNWDAAENLLKKAPPDVQQGLGANILRMKDAWTAQQDKLKLDTLKAKLTSQDREAAIAGRAGTTHETNVTKKQIQEAHDKTLLEIANIRKQMAAAAKKGRLTLGGKGSVALGKDPIFNKVYQEMHTKLGGLTGDHTFDFNTVRGGYDHLVNQGYAPRSILDSLLLHQNSNGTWMSGDPLAKGTMQVINVPDVNQGAFVPSAPATPGNVPAAGGTPQPAPPEAPGAPATPAPQKTLTQDQYSSLQDGVKAGDIQQTQGGFLVKDKKYIEAMTAYLKYKNPGKQVIQLTQGDSTILKVQ